MDLNSAILVTGGAGYIGSKVTKDLINKKFNLIIVDNLSTECKELIKKKQNFINVILVIKRKYLKLSKLITLKLFFICCISECC